MNCCKKLGCAVFVSAPSLRQLADPILDCAGNFTLALSRTFFNRTKWRVLQFIGADALNDFYSRVHGLPDKSNASKNSQDDLDAAEFCASSFSLKPLDSASGTLLNRVIAGLPDERFVSKLVKPKKPQKAQGHDALLVLFVLLCGL
jgi:hypothetical protein